MFCPKCKGLMYPKEGKIECRKCGYIQEKRSKNVVVSKQEEKELTLLEDEESSNILPKTKIKCPKCGNNEAFWILRQMRGSDEPESRFYTCTNCKHKWRED
jgi:DNA-directed RNA polymerase subunit M